MRNDQHLLSAVSCHMASHRLKPISRSRFFLKCSVERTITRFHTFSRHQLFFSAYSRLNMFPRSTDKVVARLTLSTSDPHSSTDLLRCTLMIIQPIVIESEQLLGQQRTIRRTKQYCQQNTSQMGAEEITGSEVLYPSLVTDFACASEKRPPRSPEGHGDMVSMALSVVQPNLGWHRELHNLLCAYGAGAAPRFHAI